ncbi:MAG: hypothetical protein PVJ21_10605 [Anaerolineales bacterium]|jgi:hypothetical protein
MKKKWLISALVLLMLACNALTLPLTTPTPAIVFPTFSPADTSTPVIIAPTVGQGQIDAQSLSAVIVRMVPGPFFLLGGTQNGEWLSPETVIPYLAAETYQVFGMNGPGGTVEGAQPAFEEYCMAYRIETDSYPPGGRAVGVTGSWNATPRLGQEFPTDNETYVEALRDWLVEQDIPDPVVEISQILRVDLEGDGIDEVFISASHFVDPSGHNVGPGDYSLVLMRKVVGDSVLTIPLVADYYNQEVVNQFPLTYTATLPADLNADGVMEVVVGVERWEGSGVMVFEIDGTTASPVFEALCGL